MNIDKINNNAGVSQKKTKKKKPAGEASVSEPKDKVSIDSGSVKEVTFLNYMDGSNNLESFILQNLIDMEQVGSTENMNIVAQLSRFQVPPLTKLFFGQTIKAVVNDKKFAKQLEKELGDPEGVKEFQELFSDQSEAGHIAEKILGYSPPLMEGITEMINGFAGEMAKDNDINSVISTFAMELAKETVEDNDEEVKSATLGMINSSDKEMNNLAKHMKNAIKKFIALDMKGDGKIYVAGPYKGGRVLKSAETEEGETSKEPEWIGVRRYYVTKGAEDSEKISSEVVEDMGFVNMGEPKTMTDFLVWGMKNYPAKKYVVVLSDHGAGILGGFEDRGQMMTLPQINQALADAEKETGVKPDVLVFDACLMAQAEVAYELRDRAKVMLASEETVGGAGIPYVPILEGIDELAKSGKAHEVSIANLIVDECVETSEDTTVTYSAIDLSKMDKVKKSIDKMAKAFMKAKLPMEDVKFLLHNTTAYSQGDLIHPYGDFRDLGHFTDNILRFKDMTTPEVQKAAKEVKDAISEAVFAEEHNEEYGTAYGMTFFAPHDKRWVDETAFEEYKETAMAKATVWDEFLEKTFGIGIDEDEEDDEDRKSRKPAFIQLPQRH